MALTVEQGHKFTDDVPLGEAVVVLAVRGTLTCLRNGLAKIVRNSTREKAVLHLGWNNALKQHGVGTEPESTSAGPVGPSGQQAAHESAVKKVSHILGCNSKSEASRTREVLRSSVWLLWHSICSVVSSFGFPIQETRGRTGVTTAGGPPRCPGMGACGVEGQKEPCLLIPEKRKLWEELISAYRYLLGKCKEVRDRLPSWAEVAAGKTDIVNPTKQ